MSNRLEVQGYINKLIDEENGMPLKPDDLLEDAGLDSLGLVFFFNELDFKYRLLKGIKSDDVHEVFNPSKTTLNSLVNSCMTKGKK